MTAAQSRAITEALRTGHSMKFARQSAGLTKKEFRAWVAGEGIDAVAMARDMYEQKYMQGRCTVIGRRGQKRLAEYLSQPRTPEEIKALSGFRRVR